jgi:hypothetical protein
VLTISVTDTVIPTRYRVVVLTSFVRGIGVWIHPIARICCPHPPPEGDTNKLISPAMDVLSEWSIYLNCIIPLPCVAGSKSGTEVSAFIRKCSSKRARSLEL